MAKFNRNLLEILMLMRKNDLAERKRSTHEYIKVRRSYKRRGRKKRVLLPPSFVCRARVGYFLAEVDPATGRLT